jgi:hypothetical protein
MYCLLHTTVTISGVETPADQRLYDVDDSILSAGNNVVFYTAIVWRDRQLGLLKTSHQPPADPAAQLSTRRDRNENQK